MRWAQAPYRSIGALGAGSANIRRHDPPRPVLAGHQAPRGAAQSAALRFRDAPVFVRRVAVDLVQKYAARQRSIRCRAHEVSQIGDVLLDLAPNPGECRLGH